MHLHSFRLAAAALVLLTVGGSSAMAQIVRNGPGYLLRTKYTPGQTVKFAMTTSVTVPGQPKPMAVNMPISQKVLGVSKGVADISATMGPMSMNGSPMGEAQTARVKVDALGRPIGAGKGASTFTAFPTKAVKVGEKWTVRQPLASMGGGGDIDITYTFLGLKALNGKPVAEIGLSVKSAGPQKVSGSGKAVITTADGIPATVTMALKLTGAQEGATPMDMALKVVRN